MATITPVASAVPGVFPFSMQAQQSIVVDPKSPGSIDSPHGLILVRLSGLPLCVQPVSATPLAVYRLAFGSPRSFADVD